jgi:hypothetical protein
MNKAEKELAFRNELAELLKKFNATLELEETVRSWGWTETKAVVSFNGKWDDDGNNIEESHEFKLLG